jgi:TolB-like protein/tetratricopeptide (TPR) repeat protein
LELQALVTELKRRRVFRVLVGYGVVSFAVLQIVEPIQHALGLSDAALKLVVVLLGLGFPVSMALAWAFDTNAACIERTPPAPSAALRGPRSMLLLVAFGVLVAAPGVVWVLLRGSRSAREPLPAQAGATPSIAVLPLVNMSSDKEQEYFSDGLSEELLNLLAQVPQLRVIARTSSFSFKGKDVDVATIAKALDVANVLEGSVRRSGSKLRVTAQLIRTADSSHLWSQTYDRELTDVFKVQDEIAAAVVAALKVKLLPSQAVPSARRAGSTEAYDRFLIGTQILRRGNFAEMPGALAALQEAIALDPQFAPAYGSLAWAQLVTGEFTGDVAQREASHKLGLANAEKAIALDPNSPIAYLVRGWYRCNVAWDWKGGEEDVARALAIDFNSVTTLASGGAQACLRLSRLEEALAIDRRMIASDPLSMTAWFLYGSHLLLVPGGATQGRAALQHAIEISPDAAWPRFLLGFFDLQDGKVDQALAHFRHAGPGHGLTGEAMVEHTLGHAQQSEKALDELKAKYGAGFAIQIAQVYAWRKEPKLAFEWLDRAYERHDAGLVRLRYDPAFASLRTDPRFEALVRKIGVPE